MLCRSATARTSYEDAEAAIVVLRAGVENRETVANDKLSVDGFLDKYLANVFQTKSPTTHQWYERVLRTHVRPALGRMRLHDLEAHHVRSLIANAKNVSKTSLRGEPLGSQSKANLLVAISAALQWGTTEEPRPYVAVNVARNVKPPPVEHVERVVVDLGNVQRILAAVKDTELESVITFQIGQGLRREEVVALKWSDLNLVAGSVKVQRAAVNLGKRILIKAPKTKGSRRTEFLAGFVIVALKKHQAEQVARFEKLGLSAPGLDDYVFDRWNGRRVPLVTKSERDKPVFASLWNPNDLSRAFLAMRRKNGLAAIRLHDCRHGFAALSFAAGVDIVTVSRSLGHSSLQTTTNTYVHSLSATKRSATDAFDAYVKTAVTVPKSRPKPAAKPVANLTAKRAQQG